MRYRLRTLLILLAVGSLELWCLFLLWEWSYTENLGPHEFNIITEKHIEVDGNRVEWPPHARSK